MDSRRTQLGDHIRAAREGQGYRSQQAFATACNVSMRSITAVENGEKVGRKVLTAVALGLGWPGTSANEYLRIGDLSLLTPAAERASRYPADLEDDTERELWDIKAATEEEKWSLIYQWRVRKSARLRVLQQPEQPTRREQHG